MPQTPAPLSPERLQQIRQLQGEWLIATAGKPHRHQPQLATTYAGELLSHIEARDAQVREQLQRLLYPEAFLAHLEGDDRIRCRAHNMYVRLAAQRLGLSLD